MPTRTEDAVAHLQAPGAVRAGAKWARVAVITGRRGMGTTPCTQVHPGHHPVAGYDMSSVLVDLTLMSFNR